MARLLMKICPLSKNETPSGTLELYICYEELS